MKLFKTTLTPISQFATTLKGDTLFGQLCWSIAHVYGSDKLTQLLSLYDETPFVVVSDAFAKGYVPKPKMPSVYLGEKSEDKKINRKKIWLTLKDLTAGNYTLALKDDEVGNNDTSYSSVHNAIDYKTFGTGTDLFAPYSQEVIDYAEKDMYLLLDESQFSKEELHQVLTFMGEYGYGKKSTIGKGRFVVSALEEIDLSTASKVYMTLSPAKLDTVNAQECFYDTFVRFGKFGGNRAVKNAFKVPQLMADCAAVLVFDEAQDLQYIGRSIRNVSAIYKDAVQQGYAIVMPIKELSDGK